MSTDTPPPNLPDADGRPVWAQNIAKRRKELGLTQARFAELMGVSQSAVTDWERGKSRPRLGMLYRIVAVLEIEPQQLIPDLLTANPEAAVMVRSVTANMQAMKVEIDKKAEARKFSSLFVELFRMKEALDLTYNMRRLAEDAFSAWTDLGGNPSEDDIQSYVMKEREYWERSLERNAENMERHYLERYRFETRNSG